jgi:hypothetical protein
VAFETPADAANKKLRHSEQTSFLIRHPERRRAVIFLFHRVSPSRSRRTWFARRIRWRRGRHVFSHRRRELPRDDLPCGVARAPWEKRLGPSASARQAVTDREGFRSPSLRMTEVFKRGPVVNIASYPSSWRTPGGPGATSRRLHFLMILPTLTADNRIKAPQHGLRTRRRGSCQMSRGSAPSEVGETTPPTREFFPC